MALTSQCFSARVLRQSRKRCRSVAGLVAIDFLGQLQTVGLPSLRPHSSITRHPLVDVGQAARHTSGNFHAEHPEVVIIAQLLFKLVELLPKSNQVRRSDWLQQLNLVVEVFGLFAAGSCKFSEVVSFSASSNDFAPALQERRSPRRTARRPSRGNGHSVARLRPRSIASRNSSIASTLRASRSWISRCPAP